MGFFQARILKRVAFLSPRDLPDPGTELISPASPALQADSLPLSHGGRSAAQNQEPRVSD